MYDLYKYKCFNNGRSVVKSSFYRYTLNSFFNIGFHSPKSDRCDHCEEYFYNRKLTMYNLTASTSSKECYCSIWTEMTSGRAGIDIASSFISILEKVLVDHPNITNIICWSDSCVPQNRNSHISQATLVFLSQVEIINTITMKYSVSGHSCVQEVDRSKMQCKLRNFILLFHFCVFW